MKLEPKETTAQENIFEEPLPRKAKEEPKRAFQILEQLKKFSRA